MTDPTELSTHPGFLLAQLGFHTAYRFSDLLAPLGIKPRHFGMLKLLATHDGRTQQELGEALDIHRNVMVGLVDELEKRDLVERRRHPTDRRAHALYLRPAAHAVLAEAEAKVAELDAELLAPLTPAEREQFLGLLARTATGNGLRPNIHPGLTR